MARTAAVAGKGKRSQNIAEGVLVQIHLIKGRLIALLHHPLAIVQGKPLADVDDVQRTIQVQSTL